MDLYRKLGQTGLLCEAVVKQIEDLVISSRLRPGDDLPSERELAHHFGVSRTVVREAMKVLAQKQLVTVLRGKGAVVAHPSHAPIAASLGLLFRLKRATPAQLVEIRMGLEPEMAARAAVRATPDQAEEIERMAAASWNYLNDPDAAISLDTAFHRAISDAAQNEVAKVVLDSVRDLYRESVLPCYQVNGSPERAARHHGEIASAIARHDPVAARRHMRRHLDRVWRDVARLEGQPSTRKLTPTEEPGTRQRVVDRAG